MKENNNKIGIMKDCVKIAHYLNAFANEKRISIVCLLKNGERTVTEISEALRMPQSSVSINLEKLYVKEIVYRRREGRFVYYGLNKNTLKMIVRKLNELF